ncbi:MAG: SH3 domain-containing protein [Clostridia bacterium]|nr:SH3 domain-containing protein [Clostridia bacterium]
MRILRKMIAVLLVLAVALSSAALAETYVKFTGNARGYKKAGSGKTNVVIKKGSVSCAEDGLGKKWTKVYVDEEHELWFKTKQLKKTKSDDVKILYYSGGSGRSTYDDEGVHRYKTGKKYVYATGKCNIRKSPGLDGKSLGTLKKGAKLKYLGRRAEDDRGVHWYKVKTTGGKSGWVSEAFTKLK